MQACTLREIQQLIVKTPDWSLGKDGKSLVRELKMPDFVSAVELIRRVADAAEALDHHPDVHLTGYKNLRFELSTHSAGGVTDLDFRLAAQIDALLVSAPRSERRRAS